MPEPITPTVKRIKDASFYRDRLVNNISAVGEANYRAGLAAPKKDTIAESIKNEPRYKDEMTKVLQEERRAKMLKLKSSLAEWGKYAGIFSDRLVPGVVDRSGEVDKFWTKWQPVLSTHVSEIDPLATATFAERKAKMIANVDKLKARKGAWLGAVGS